MKLFARRKNSGKKKTSLFFGKDEEGNDLFYPWIYPGEAFLIKGRKKIIVTASVASLFCAFWAVLIGTGILKALNLGQSKYLDDASALLIILLSIVYFCLGFILRKSLEAYKVPIYDRPKKKIVAGWLLLLLPGHLSISIIGDHPLSFFSLFLIFLNAAYAVCLVLFLIKLHKTRGYFFLRET